MSTTGIGLHEGDRVRRLFLVLKSRTVVERKEGTVFARENRRRKQHRRRRITAQLRKEQRGQELPEAG